MADEKTALQNFTAGEIIFAEGSQGELAYVVREGEVDILKGAGAQPVLLRTLQAGEMFGEMSLITTNPRAATALAKTAVVLEVVDRVDFAQMLQRDSGFAMLTMKRLAGMVPEAQARLMSAFKSQLPAAKDGPAGGRGLFGLRRKERDEVAAFEPDFVQIEQQTVPATIRFAGFAICAFLLVAVIWTTLAFTDTTVTGTGKIISTVPNISVQPLDTGIVRRVEVRPGALVKRGQLLATFDPTISEADLQATRSQLVSTEAQVKRLQAELGRSGKMQFSPDHDEQQLQHRLYEARVQQLRSTLAAQDEEARNLETQIVAKRSEARDAERQLVVLRDIARVRETFFKREQDAFMRDGQYHLAYLEAQRAQVQAEQELGAVLNSVVSLQSQVRTKRAQREAFLNDWNAKSSQDLVMAMREQSRLVEQFKKFDRANRLIELTAPIDGVVLSVRTRTPGTIVRAAESFVEIVPTDVPLEIEVDIGSRDVAQLQLGDTVKVKLDALPFVKYGSLDGRLRLISEDAFDKTLNGQPGPVFRARVSIEKSNLVLTPKNFRLLPGMSVSADVKVGTRKLITYFTYPILRSGQTSFREP